MTNTLAGAGRASVGQIASAHVTPRQRLSAARSFFGGTQMRRAPSVQHYGRERLVVQNFKFMKNLGIKKPAFLPDFGLDKRKAVLDKFFTSHDRSSLQSLLSDDAKIHQASSSQPLSKEGFIKFVSEEVKPAIPDFSWSHTTSGEKDDEGYSIVQVQVAGTHTGKPFRVQHYDLPPVDPSKKRVSLPEQTLKVKVEDGLVKEIKFLSQRVDLLSGIYKGVGGKVPAGV